MKITELPRELLLHILSYNNFPFCSSTCRSLLSIEDSLFSVRYRRIDETYGIRTRSSSHGSKALIGTVSEHDWESFSFIYSNICNINGMGDQSHIQDLFDILKNKKRNDIVRNIVRRTDPFVSDYDYDYERNIERLCNGASNTVITALYGRGYYDAMIIGVSNNIKLRRCKNVRYLLSSLDTTAAVRVLSDIIKRGMISGEQLRHAITDLCRYENMKHVVNTTHQFLIILRGDLCNCSYCTWKRTPQVL